MKLDRHIIELMTLLEKSGGRESYTFIPQLIREEVASFTIKPGYVKDQAGNLQRIELVAEVEYYEKKQAS